MRYQTNGGRSIGPASSDVASALEKETRWPGWELFPDPLQVAAVIGQVAVLGEAVGHHVVGGLVALDPYRCPGKINTDGEPAVDTEQNQREDGARPRVGDHRPRGIGARRFNGHREPASRGMRGPPRGHHAGSSDARRGAGSRRAVPSCERMSRCRIATTSAPPLRRDGRAAPDRRSIRRFRRPGPRAFRFGTIIASRSSVRTSSSPSASVARIGLAHRQRFEYRQRRPLPERWETR